MYHCVRRAGIISWEVFVFPTRGSGTPPPREARHLPGTPGRNAPSVGFADTSPGGGGYPYAVMVNKVTLCRVADEVSLYPKWLTRQVHMKDAGTQSIPQDVHYAGAERSHVVESAKPGKPPPAEPREARREGAGGAQRRATRFAAGGGHDPPPWRGTCGGEYGTSPEKPPAERVLPAPRAGERTLSAFFHWLRPLRPAPGTVRSRPARVRFFVFSLYNHRAPRLQKLSFSAPRERYPKNFFCPFPARRTQ